MTIVELTVPCVAAHLLAEGVLRFLPTDADTKCETCPRDVYGKPIGSVEAEAWVLTDPTNHLGWAPCPDCNGSGRRPFRPGDRIAIRADNDVPGHCEELGRWMVTHKGDGTIVMYDTRAGRNYYGAITLHPGGVVGYATVARVLPIISGGNQELWALPLIVNDDLGVTAYEALLRNARDLSDHLDAGLVFTPGQIALELDAENDR